MRVVHIADTHIRNLKHHDELKYVLELISGSLAEHKPDLIVHVGDVVDNKVSISPELISMVAEFFNMLSQHAPVIVVPGNHDGLVHNLGRMTALRPIFEVMDNSRIKFMEKTSTHIVGNLAFHSLSIFEPQDEWKSLKFPKDKNIVNVGLYHGTVGHVKTDSNFHMEGEVDLSEFSKFDFLMLGHIHMTQQVDTEGRAWYCGSTMQCSHDEAVEKGYLLWDINGRDEFSVKKVMFANPKPFQTIQILDANELINNFDHFKLLPNCRLRIVVNDPNFTLTDEDNIKKILRAKVNFSSVQFIKGVGAKRQDIENSIQSIELNKLEVQQSLIAEHLTTILDVKDDKLIQDILAVNAKLFSEEDVDEYVLKRNTEFKIKTLGWSNMFSYGHDNEIDFDDFQTNTIIGIFGENFSGKSSIIDVLCFVLWGEVTKDIEKNVEMMRTGTKESSAYIEFEHGNRRFKVERALKKSKSGTVKGELEFYAVGEENKLEDKKKNTDKEIITFVGDFNDFLMTSFMSQFSGMMFVNEKSAARREILKRILNLGVFDKRVEKLNKEIYYLDTKRRNEYQEGLDEEVQKMRVQIESFDAELESKRDLYKEVDRQVLEYQKFDTMVQTEKERLSGMNEVEFVRIDEKSILANYLAKKREIFGMLDSLVPPVQPRWFVKHDGVRGLMREIDEVKAKINEWDSRRSKVISSIKDLEKTISGYETKNVDEDIPCLNVSENMVTSCSLAEYYVSSKNITEQKRKELSILKQSLVCIDEFESGEIDRSRDFVKILQGRLEAWKRFDTRLVEFNKDGVIYHAKLDVASRVATEYRLAVQKNKKFEQTKDQRVKYEKLNEDNKLNLSKLQDAKRQRDEITREGQILRDRKSAMLERLKVILEKEKQFQDDLYRATVVKTLHKVFVGNSGLTIAIMKKFIPMINAQANEILSEMSDIVLKLEATEKDTIVLSFTNGGSEDRSVGTSSGAERTMISIALRMALAAITSLPTSNLFILDEPATAFDEKRLIDFEKVIHVVKSRFPYVIMITHIEALKEYVDTVMCVEINDGISRLFLGR